MDTTGAIGVQRNGHASTIATVTSVALISASRMMTRSARVSVSMFRKPTAGATRQSTGG